MADPATKTDDKTPPGTGQDVDVVIDHDNEEFLSEFDSFASGDKPDPKEDTKGDNLDGDQDGDKDQDDKSPSDKPADQPAPGVPPAADAAPDPWSNATPEQIAARDKIIAEYERKVAGSSGRASSLARELNALKAKAPAPAEAKPAGKSDAEKAIDDEIKRVSEEYPEIAGPFVKILERQAQQIADLSGAMAPVIESDNRQAVVEQQKSLEALHPDWRSFDPNINADFAGWKASQAPTIQALADSNSADEVSAALTLFKTQRGMAMATAEEPAPKIDTATDDKRQRQLDAGRAIGSRPAALASGAPDDFDGAFAFFEQQDAAKRK